MFKLVDDRNIFGEELRMSFVKALQNIMDNNQKVLMLEADLGEASASTKIQKSHSTQFIQCGISEANMVGVASGLSVMGYRPFLHTFGPFATRRVFDQIYLSGAYAHNTINIYGSDPGFTAGPNGGTHTTFEDVALMRSIPNSVICDAADSVQLAWIVRKFATMEGIHYLRANRKAVRNIYTADSKFELGKGNVLRQGHDVLIITAGQIVSDALDAAEILEDMGLSVEVIDMFTIKPLDINLILKSVENKRAIVTFENHSIYGGLGSAVSEVLAESSIATKFKRHGIDERFGQVGSPKFLQQEFKLTAKDLVETILALIK